MKIIGAIPARYAATRFPGKLMKELAGKTIITRTYEAAVNMDLFDEVVVITDSEDIKAEIEKSSGKVIMSHQEHETGTDRIAEAAQMMDADIIINIQGDEPFITKNPLEKLINAFESDHEKDIDLATLMYPTKDEELIDDLSRVRVVTDLKGFAMYFSRAKIPYPKDASQETRFYNHIGIYAFRKQALLDFATMPIGPLERLEKMEGLRFLENGRKIKMVISEHRGIGIDTPEDMERALRYL